MISFMDIDNLKKQTPLTELVCKALIPKGEVQLNHYSKNYKEGYIAEKDVFSTVTTSSGFPKDNSVKMISLMNMMERLYNSFPL